MFYIAPLLVASLLSADVTIEQAAPENTIAFASTSNIGKIVTNLESTGACSQICDTVCGLQGGDPTGSSLFDSTQYTEMFAAMGIEDDWFLHIIHPSGYAGAALYPVVDYETGSVGLGALVLLELDEKAYGDFFTISFDDYMTNTEIDAESISLAGSDVWMIQLDLPPIQAPMMQFDVSTFERSYVVYSDGYLVIGSEPDGIASALLALDGNPEDGMLESNSDFNELRSRCGEGDVFAGVLLTNLADTIMQIDDSNMAMMFLPTLKTLFGDIDGIAESVTFAPSEDVLLEVTYTLLMNDGRNGLLGLVGENAAPVPTPAFVNEDTLTYMQGIIDLNKLVPLIRETIMGQPMLAMQVGPQMDAIEAGLAALLSPLGSEFHSLSSGSMPFDIETVGTLFAIQCNDEEALTGTLSMTLPSMGAEPSDFLGNQIYTIDLGSAIPIPVPMPMEYSIAVGGGYVFIGTRNNVENALRAMANPKDNRPSELGNQAVTLLGSIKSSSWGYGDIAKSIEVQMAMQTAMADNFLRELESYDPEMAEEIRIENEDENSIQEAIMIIISSIMGPVAWDSKTDEYGLTSHVIMMKPEQK